nr:telomere zinc finger-associated protein-like [Megalopta genalis]
MKHKVYGFRKSHVYRSQVSRGRHTAPEESPLECPQCGRTYKMKRNLKTHMRFECGGQRNFTCHICPARYTQNIGLRRHLLQKHNTYLPERLAGSVYGCSSERSVGESVVPGSFRLEKKKVSRSTLPALVGSPKPRSRRAFRPDGVSPVRRPRSRDLAAFSDLSNALSRLYFSGFRKSHVYRSQVSRGRHTAPEESPLECPQCGRTYKMKRNLKTHMRFECGGQRNFTCHICPARYTQNIGLRRHLLQKHNTYLPPKFSIPKRIFAGAHEQKPFT